MTSTDFASVARTLRVREASLKGSPHKSALDASERCARAGLRDRATPIVGFDWGF